MSTLTIKTQVTHKEEREVTIPIPSFWKNGAGSEFKALVDKNTFVWISFFKAIDTVSLQVGAAENFNREAASAHQRWETCTEDEFFEAYRKARKQTEILPVINAI
jgi:hypothetical protein